MIKKILKTNVLRKKQVEYETYDYWESTTDESIVNGTLEYWSKIGHLRNKPYSVKELSTIEDKDLINALFAEHIMGWAWSDSPIPYIEEFIPTGFMINEKIKTNITHYTHKSVPVQLPDFTSDEYALKVMDRLKISRVRYGLQPIDDGYEIYSEKHRVSIFGKTLGEAICKLALITQVEVYKY